MKEVIVVLLNEFADWEGAFIAPFLNGGLEPGRAKYNVKTLSTSKEPVVSIGGFRVIPDYDLTDVPNDYVGLVLIGGMQWFSPEAVLLAPLVKKASAENKLVAGICNASVYLGMQGLLNDVKHTSNTLEFLKESAKDKYIGEANYIYQQAVRDKNLVTANGSATLEFCREILYALEADVDEKIEACYNYFKLGHYEFLKQNQ